MVSLPTIWLRSSRRGLVDHALARASLGTDRLRSSAGYTVALLPGRCPGSLLGLLGCNLPWASVWPRPPCTATSLFQPLSVALLNGLRHGIVACAPPRSSLRPACLVGHDPPQTSPWPCGPHSAPILVVISFPTFLPHSPCRGVVGCDSIRASLLPCQLRSASILVVFSLTLIQFRLSCCGCGLFGRKNTSCPF